MSEPTDYAVTSVEDAQGRILSGVGATVEDLEKTMERHAPPEPETPVEAPATQQPPPPQESKPTRGQKRFSELTSERDKERHAREAAERERDELRAKLAAGTTQPASRPADDARITASPQHSGEVSRGSDRPEHQRPPEPDFEKDYEAHVGEKYQTYGAAVQAFNRDYVQWSQAEIDARIRSSIEADRASREFTSTIQQTLTKGKELHPDVDAVRTQGPGSQIVLPGPKLEAIVKSPYAAHFIYEIAKDAALAQRLASASDIEFGMELARISPSATSAPPASPVVTGSSMPPAPYQPVGSGSKTTAPPLDDLVKKAGHDFDKSGYREKRAEQLGRLRRR